MTDNIAVLHNGPQGANGPDIVLRPHATGPFMRVPNTHWAHDAFIFPLLFPDGKLTPSWHPKLFLPPGTGTTAGRDMARERRISPPMFYRGQLAARPSAELRAIATSGAAWPIGTQLSLTVQVHGHMPGTPVVAEGAAPGDWGDGPRCTNVRLRDDCGVQFIVTNATLKLRMVAGSLANEHLFRAGRLLQQYVATQAARADVWRMAWVRSPEGQKALRAEEYGALTLSLTLTLTLTLTLALTLTVTLTLTKP